MYDFAALPFPRFLADLHKIHKVGSLRQVLDPIKIPGRSGWKRRHCDGKTGVFFRFLTFSLAVTARIHRPVAGLAPKSLGS